MIRHAVAPLLQFVHPAKAHLLLLGRGSWKVMVFCALLILAGSAAVAAGTLSSLPGLPFFVLLERAFVASLGGAAVWALARAQGERHGVLPAIQSAFMSMTAWVLCLAALVWVSRIAGFPPGFSWSTADLAPGLPSSPLGAFIFIVLLSLDIPSVATVFIWGRGLSAVWGTDRSFGIRLVWAVFLLAVLLQAAPVLVNQAGSEVLCP